MNKKFNFAIISIVSTLICIGIVVFGLTYTKNSDTPKKSKNKEKSTESFNIKIIKSLNVNENFLISPYSIEVALNMLNEGAGGNTKKEISNLINDREIADVSIKNRVNIANAVFIKDKYKNIVKDEFKNTLVKKYDSEVLYDMFKTPFVINNWVNEKTDGMIEKVIDEISEDFVLGLANAIAIDVQWLNPFECNETTGQEFTKDNGKKIKVQMMHNSFRTNDVKYLESDDAKGIILPYLPYNSKTGEVDRGKDSNLEFIGILPNSNVSSYIDGLTDEKLDGLINSASDASGKNVIKVSLPRFTYEYDAEDFSKALRSLGIIDAFNPSKADFSKIASMKDLENENLYVNKAVHKTFIDLNETGTKAAAVTFFGIDSFSTAIDNNVTNITFDKPFIYMIRDNKTKEVLFFGAVYEPNVWNGSTCSK